MLASMENIENEGRNANRDRKLRIFGGLLTAVALCLGCHVLVAVIGLLQGHPASLPVMVLAVEAGTAVLNGAIGFCMLVAGATPFDESEAAPLLRYDDQPRDPFA